MIMITAVIMTIPAAERITAITMTIPVMVAMIPAATWDLKTEEIQVLFQKNNRYAVR